MKKVLTHFDYQGVKIVQSTVSFMNVKLKSYLYFVDGLLIDTGPSSIEDVLKSHLKTIPFTQVVHTHHHEDHTGLSKWIQGHYDVPMYVHESGVDDCTHVKPIPLYRRLFWGNRKPFTPQAIPPIIETEKYKFEVIHTPGHAHDHVVLFNKDTGWLFSGDLYLMSRPKSMFAFESVPVLIESMKKILTYDFTTMFCSHAGVIEDGRNKIAIKLAYLEDIQHKVLTLHTKGVSPKRIQKQLFPKRTPLNYFSLFENSASHIVRSILNEEKLLG
ncbi:MBL fold metallo-hydrolase [Cytobacillus sp. IB215316]|uniref:MBL fold metallo-hydrolase n=1 Tax=Cytobacillus sp. IB215316 TaxID=3097354 RepID=UPI002A11D442|nr:MBL fold metallo-hydrolase [Cytobacillus sp. IB215316]MDX8360799.1 MBL fold metallo-hydrolase [Cytobacillus sp. IB215316]